MRERRKLSSEPEICVIAAVAVTSRFDVVPRSSPAMPQGQGKRHVVASPSVAAAAAAASMPSGNTPKIITPGQLMATPTSADVDALRRYSLTSPFKESKAQLKGKHGKVRWPKPDGMGASR